MSFFHHSIFIFILLRFPKSPLEESDILFQTAAVLSVLWTQALHVGWDRHLEIKIQPKPPRLWYSATSWQKFPATAVSGFALSPFHLGVAKGRSPWNNMGLFYQACSSFPQIKGKVRKFNCASLRFPSHRALDRGKLWMHFNSASYKLITSLVAHYALCFFSGDSIEIQQCN